MVTEFSIRKRVLEVWTKNPYVTPKKLCQDLQLNYKQHGNYVKKLLSEFRGYYRFGSPQEALRCPHRRVFVWDNIPRELLLGLGELDRRMRYWGWCVVRNRNDMWVFRDDRGSVHWYKGGLVRLYLRGEVKLARAKELFCRAFSWFTPEEFKKYLDVPLREESRHWVFDIGAPMPRFDIRQFERTHGIRIFNDKSHVTSIEVEETEPFWIQEQRQSTSELAGVVQQFGVEINEHLKLIQLWQKEAKGLRLRPLKRKIKRVEVPSQKSLLNWMVGG